MTRTLADKLERGPSYEPERLRAHLALALAQEMARRDVSQRELARRAGVSHTFVRHILLAEKNPTIDVVAKLFGALGMRLRLRPEDR